MRHFFLFKLEYTDTGTQFGMLEKFLFKTKGYSGPAGPTNSIKLT